MEEETLHDAFARFLDAPGRSPATKNKFRHKFKMFLEEYGQTAVADITPATIENWFFFLENRKGYSEGHLAFHRSCHKTFWGWLGLDIVTIPRFSEAPPVITAATDEEIRRLLIACRHMWSTIHQQRDAAMIALGTAGLRRSNIQYINASEAQHALNHPIDHNGRSYYVLHTKGKQSMEAILDEERATILRRYVTSRPATSHNRLFINLNQGHERYLEPLTEKAYEKARINVCKKAGIRTVTFQEMRRWLGTKIASTKNIQIAAQALGHKSGVSVILNHYYNPDKTLSQTAVLDAYKS